MKKLQRYLPDILWLTVMSILAIYFYTAMPFHLKWQEQNQIFVSSSDWLDTYFDKPAWLGCMAADWLIQYFCDPAAAAIILSLAIYAASRALQYALSGLIKKQIALIITIIYGIWLVLTTFNELSSLPFILCMTGGILIYLCKLRAYVSSSRQIDASPLLVVPAYWLFGIGASLAALLMALRGILKEKRIGVFTASAAAMLAAISPLMLASRYSLTPFKAAMYPGIPSIAWPDKERTRRLAIDDAYYRDDLDEAKRLALQTESPNDISAFYYYLASARQDSLPDNLLKYPVKNLGTLITIGENTPLPVINIMNDLYFTLGDMTYAERAAMMRNVFSPHNRNSRMIRRLAEINLITGDTLAAMKYLRILDHVHSLKEWSRDHKPGNMTQKAEAEIMKRRENINKMPDLRTGDNCRFILLQLLESNHQNTIALDYLLCTDLLLKDMDTFKQDYDTYCMAKDSPRYKNLYQQALMIYLAGTGAEEEEWQKYIVSEEQLKRFNAYSLRRGDKSFADTYWYYFDTQK